MSEGEVLDRPTILIVGRKERMQAALEQALARHDVEVESVALGAIADAAFAAAPDLLLLIGDAAEDGGEAALRSLEGHAGTSTVPVALLAGEGLANQPLGEFRHGVVAVIRRTASADGMAREIAALARDVPQRSGELAGELGEEQIDALVNLFNQQLRTGILSVRAEGDENASAQVVLRAGRSATDAMSELVDRLRPLLEGNRGPIHYEFHESPRERLDLLDVAPDAEEHEPAAFAGLRILLIEQSPARADALVQELRTAGALVIVADGEGRGLERARTHDPDLVILDGSGMESWATRALRHLRRDPRLRWASLLVVDAGEVWPEGTDRPSLQRLSRSVHAMLRPDRDLAARAAGTERFETRLELIGPVRLLRALLAAGLGVEITVRHPRTRVVIDLAEGLVVGARAYAPRSDEELAEGPAALAALLGLASGRVRVERREAPSTANLMAPLDDALAAAASERSPVSPSLPPPTPSEGLGRPSSSPPSASRDAERLLARLEDLLERLGHALPSERAAAPSERAPEPVEPAATKPAQTSAAKPSRVPRPGGVIPAVTRAGDGAAPGARGAVERAPVVPPPRRVGLAETRKPPLSRPPPAERPRAKPAARPPWERPSAPPSADDDIPVIEATAEPGELARADSPDPRPTPTEPAAAPTAPTTPPVFEATAIEQSDVPPPPPPIPPAFPPATELVLYTEPLAAPPPAPLPAPAAVVEEPLELPRSRAPLFVAGGLAALVIVGTCGGLATWALLADDDPVAAATLPGTAGEPLPARTVPTEPPSPAAVSPVDAPPPEPTPEATPAPAPTPALAADEPTPEPGPEPEVAAAPADPEPPRAPSDPVEVDQPEATEDDGGANAASREREVAHLLRSGNFDRNRGRLREAEVAYLRALRLSPRNVRALVGLTRVAIARRDGPQAVRWATQLNNAAPRNPNNAVLLGDAYRAAGQRAQAEDAYRRAIELQPGHPNATRRLQGR
ncbi:MAG: hypothetical protein KF729_16240 [Sandaracinaceae bacterium]|nr:hypothetical protein [Sandaracinaceae bacterium]